MAVHFIATDLDGTLIAESGLLSRENLDAMREAQALGTLVLPTTGRSFYETPAILRQEAPFDYCICSNGAVTLDRNGKVKRRQTFPAALTAQLVSILREYDTMIEVYVDSVPVTEQRFLNTASYRHFRVEENYHAVLTETRRGVSDFDAFLSENAARAEMFNIFFHDAQERAAAFERIGALGTVDLTTSMQSNMEILQKNVNKGTALKALCADLNIDPADGVAMGDSRNDLPLLAAVGTGLAVANACDALKRAATAVICSNDEHAFAYVVRRYLKGN